MSDVSITPLTMGPITSKGSLKLVTNGRRGIAVDGNEIWLCRCGHWANVSCCDGPHKQAGFMEQRRREVVSDAEARSE